MRIAMVSEHASPLATLGGVDAGGQNVHVAALATELARAGHEVTVYTRRDDADLPERVAMPHGVRVVHVDAGPARPLPKDHLLPFMADMGRWIQRDWRERGLPDVVHSHFWMSGLAARTAARRLQVPVVHTYHALGSVKRRHQGAADPSPPQRVHLETRLGREVDAIVATCTDEVTELVRMGVPDAHVHVVPCGVDTTHFTPGPGAAQPWLTWEPLPYRLLSVGRLVERKGLATVVEALPSVPGAELVVAGGPADGHLDDEPEVRRLRALAARLGVAGRVHFVGAVPREQVPALMRASDVVVATPWYEPFGIVPLEAAACGRPLVGSAVGGLLDSVQHGVTGVLVPPRDPAALARELRLLLADPARRRRLGEAARRRAVRLYDWRQVAARTLTAYESVVYPSVKEATA